MSLAVILMLSWKDHEVTTVLLLVINLVIVTLLCVILILLNLYDSSIAEIAQFLAAWISERALALSTSNEVVYSRDEDSFSLVTLKTSVECSAVLLSSPSDYLSSSDDLQKTLVAATKLLSKNFFL